MGELATDVLRSRNPGFSFEEHLCGFPTYAGQQIRHPSTRSTHGDWKNVISLFNSYYSASGFLVTKIVGSKEALGAGLEQALQKSCTLTPLRINPGRTKYVRRDKT